MKISNYTFPVYVFLFILTGVRLVSAQTALYGTRNKGGDHELGFIFRADNNGSNYQETYHFTSPFVGKNPVGELTEYSSGLLYGTTEKGGTYNSGVIYKYEIASSQYTVLFNFRNAGDSGYAPKTKLLKALNGKLYGIASKGGVNNAGVLFEFDPAGNQYVIKHPFIFATGMIVDTALTHSLMQASDGNIYGCTDGGGVNAFGVVFSCDSNGDNYTKLKDFTAALGKYPVAALTEITGSKLAGMAYMGGANDEGTVFIYDIGANHLYRIHEFQNFAANGAFPQGGLLFLNDNLWGTTYKGGLNNEGFLFELDTMGNILSFYNAFDQNNGSHPVGGLVTGNVSAGLDTLFGCTNAGGINTGEGLVFYYVPSNSSYGTYELAFYSTGAYPTSGLIQSTFDNKFYAAANSGGEAMNAGTMYSIQQGTLFKKFEFNQAGLDGGLPFGKFCSASNGKIYGTTRYGGTNDGGIFYRINTANNTIIKLADFTNTTGIRPNGLVEHPNGKLYGTCAFGGANGFGTIFEIDTLSNSITSLSDLNNATGYQPGATLLVGNDLNLYFTCEQGGASNGTLTKYDIVNDLTPVLYQFGGTPDGSYPTSDLIQSDNGNIIGLTDDGGNNFRGTIFSYNPVNTNYSILRHFNNVDGCCPKHTHLTFAKNTLYGYTSRGATNNDGTLFRNILPGNIYSYYDFVNAAITGSIPSDMVLSDNGSFYGINSFGGSNGSGVFFSYDTLTNAVSPLLDFSLIPLNNSNIISTSNIALTNCTKPSISTQPQNVLTCPGTNVSFSVTANGSGISYQWFKNQQKIPAATASTLSFSGTAFSDTGLYHCVIANACGYVLTQFVTLTVEAVQQANVIINGQNTICPWDSVSLITPVIPGYTYQWQIDGTYITGATGNELYADTTGNYTVIIAIGPGCSDTSSFVTVTDLPILVPSVSITSSTDTICTASVVNFSANSVNAGSGAGFQWYVNGILEQDDTLSTFSFQMQNNDTVYLKLTSVADCAQPNPVFSNSIAITDTCLVDPEITQVTVSGAPFCAGNPFNVDYTTSSDFNTLNNFIVELSNNSGSFGSPVVIGQLSGTGTSGSVPCLIPSGSASGALYQVRVIATNPPDTSVLSNAFQIRSNNFGLNFIASPLSVTLAPANVTFTNSTPSPGSYTFQWDFGDGYSSNLGSSTVVHQYPFNGVFDVSLLATDMVTGCTDTLYRPEYVEVNIPGNPSCNHTASINGPSTQTICQGGFLNLTGQTSAANATYQWNRNGVPIVNSNALTIHITQGGSYKFIAFENGVCPKYSAPVMVTTSQISQVPPIISATGSSAGCLTTNYTLTASGNYTSWLWSNGSPNASINITQGGTYTVTGISGSCSRISDPLVIAGTSAVVPLICMVTVDTTNNANHNIIVWEDTVNTNVANYIIFREDTIPQNAGIYNPIGTVNFSDDHEFYDTTSYAQLMPYRYKLGVTDACGGISVSPAFQQSMHLTNRMGNNIKQRKLLWNSYFGQPQGVSHYLIYREDLLTGAYEQIDSVPGTVTVYFDQLPFLRDTARNYIIGYRLLDACDASRAAVRKVCNSNSSGNPKSLPQIDTNAVVRELDLEQSWTMSPNPCSGQLQVKISGELPLSDNDGFTIFDVFGNRVFTNLFQSNNQIFADLRHLAQGVYFVRMDILGNRHTRKLIIQY